MTIALIALIVIALSIGLAVLVSGLKRIFELYREWE